MGEVTETEITPALTSVIYKGESEPMNVVHAWAETNSRMAIGGLRLFSIDPNVA